MPTKEEIFEQVQEVLVDALGAEEEEVTSEATLVDDLGAESIDFLDIVFQLEKAFEIKIPRGEFIPQDVFTSEEFVNDGKLTEAGLTELRERLPYFNLDSFAANPVVQEFPKLLTVADLCRFVETKIG